MSSLKILKYTKYLAAELNEPVPLKTKHFLYNTCD